MSADFLEMFTSHSKMRGNMRAVSVKNSAMHCRIFLSLATCCITLAISSMAFSYSSCWYRHLPSNKKKIPILCVAFCHQRRLLVFMTSPNVPFTSPFLDYVVGRRSLINITYIIQNIGRFPFPSPRRQRQRQTRQRLFTLSISPAGEMLSIN